MDTKIRTIAALLLSTLAATATADEPRRLPPLEPAQTTVAAPTPSESLDEAVTPVAFEPAVCWECEGGDPAAEGPRFEIGAKFDKGIFIRGTDLKRDPFAVYIGARMQLRHTGFTRDNETWTDSAGVTRTIRNRNNFESERLRLNISGNAIDPNLSYYIIFDGDADGGSNVDQLAYIFTYAFDDAFKVRLGRWKAASDREWLLSSRFFSLADRSMATEFFRVGFTDGIWLLGDVGETWHYETSLTNGLRTSTRRAFDLDDNLGAALTLYTDPLGPYGNGFADYACHSSPAVRFGGSLAFDKADDRSDAGFPLGDDGFLRLSDGTRLSDVGALGPGVRLLGDRVFKGGVDFAMKYRGWAISTEWFFRSIQDLTADGPIVINQIDDHGYRCDVGVFVVPQRLDVWSRVSHVSGPFGDAYEYAAGFNYYWGSHRTDGKLDDRVNKFTFDVTSLDGSPTSSTPADLLAGDDGVLFRTQMQFTF